MAANPNEAHVPGTGIRIDNDQASRRNGADIAKLLADNPALTAATAEALAPVRDRSEELTAAELARQGIIVDGFNPKTGEFDWKPQ